MLLLSVSIGIILKWTIEPHKKSHLRLFVIGHKAEQHVYNKLRAQYSVERYIILDAHSFCELDWVVLDKQNENVVEIIEVKSTSQDTTQFRAGSVFQVLVFARQQDLKNDGEPFIPCSLWVVKVDSKSYDDGKLRVLGDKVYHLDRLEIDVAQQKWSIK